jgi:hypothetical protein
VRGPWNGLTNANAILKATRFISRVSAAKTGNARASDRGVLMISATLSIGPQEAQVVEQSYINQLINIFRYLYELYA